MFLRAPEDFSFIGNFVLVVLLIGVLILVFFLIRIIIITILNGIEMLYALFKKRPIYVHFYPLKKQLSPKQLLILKNKFSFYSRLSKNKQQYFRHRVATFIAEKQFEGKEGFIITDEVRVLVAATGIMLTFGFRDYKIKYIEQIIIYPKAYYSIIGKQIHKGEFNPRLKTLVLSWDNFIEGFNIENDKLNLGIHEFSHAIHFNSIKNEDINSILFVDTFNEIRKKLKEDVNLKSKLKSSNLLRNYAFTNDSELLAVAIETFIESPKSFKLQFPNIYKKIKQMLNFNFAGY